jgi:hypothetical protein
MTVEQRTVDVMTSLARRNWLGRLLSLINPITTRTVLRRYDPAPHDR